MMRPLLVIPVAGLLVLATTFWAGYSYLRGPGGSRWLVSMVQRKVSENTGFHLEFSEALLDPFSVIRFKNLKLTEQAGAGGHLALSLPLFEARYRVSLLSLLSGQVKVEVERILLDQPSILFHSQKRISNSTATALATAFEGGGASSATAFTWPRVSLVLKDLEINQLKVDLDAASLGMSLGMKAVSSARFGLDVRSEGQTVTVQVKPSSFHFSMESLSFQKGLGTPESFELKLADLSLDTRLQAEFSAARKDLKALDLKGGLKIREGALAIPGRKIAFGSQELLWEGARSGSSVGASLNLNSRRFFSEPDSRTAADFHGKIALQLETEKGQVSGSGRLRLGELELLRSEWTGEVGDALTLAGKTQVSAPVALSHFFKAADALRSVGDLQGAFHWNGDLLRGQDSQLEFSGKSQGTWTQVGKRMGGGIAFNPLSMDFKWGSQGKVFDGQAVLGLELQRAPGLRKPLRTALLGNFKWNIDKNQMGLNGSLKLQDQPVFQGEATLTQQEKQFKVLALLEGTTGAYLEAFLTPESLRFLGSNTWAFKSKLDTDFDSSGSFALHSHGTTELTPQGPAPVSEPFRLEQDVVLKEGGLQATLTGGIAKLDFPRQARIEDLRVMAEVRSTQNWDQVDFKFGVTQKLLALDPALAGKVVSFPDFRMEGKGRVVHSDRFSLDEWTASLKGPAGAPLFQFRTEASGGLRAGSFENSGSAEVFLSKELAQVFGKLAHQEVSGKISFPWTLTLRHARELHFEGQLKATDVAWVGPVRVEGISGTIPISEKLVWDGKRLHFASLISLNPFERVDFERFRPLVERSDRFQVARVGLEEKNYGPLNGFFSVRQNMIFANQVGFRLGAGEAAGEMYFNMHPANLQLGVLSRLTGLDLAEVLPKRMLLHALEGDQRISGRSNLVMNFNRAAVDGRVDVTEIGGAQLITLINVLDPKFENEQMNKTRTLLGIAYPTQVEMAFQKGFLDMGIQLGGLLKEKINLRGIPLTGWITGVTAQVVKKTEGGLLK